MTISTTRCQRLPAAGETVVINGLASASELNGKQGQIAHYVKDIHRYRVKLQLDDGSKKTLAVKPQNISLLPNKKTDEGSSIRGNDAFYYCGDWDITHVLVPCHLEDKRRYKQFRQCVRSLVHQTGKCRIFVSISGPAEIRQLAMESLRFCAVIPENGIGRQHQWIVLDEVDDSENADYTKKSQFQHYKSILSVSVKIKPNAWLMFLDNDDLYHPFRAKFFQDIIASRRHEENEVEKAFYCGGKLLIDVAQANAKFGDDIIEYDMFVSHDEKLTGLVDVAASRTENEDKDVSEYFDFCVKTEIFQRFIEVTPDEILSHQFCDVRFAGSLSHPRIKCYEHPLQEWLLMHYRVRGHDRHQTYLDLDLATYTNAMLKIEVSDDDRHLEHVTGLKDSKISFLRRDIEECAIQAVHRDDENVLFYRNRRVPYMDETHGHEIGTLLWDQVMSKLEGYYTEEQAKNSRDWWIECKIPPPPAEDDALTDNHSKYW